VSSIAAVLCWTREVRAQSPLQQLRISRFKSWKSAYFVLDQTGDFCEFPKIFCLPASSFRVPKRLFRTVKGENRLALHPNASFLSLRLHKLKTKNLYSLTIGHLLREPFLGQQKELEILFRLDYKSNTKRIHQARCGPDKEPRTDVSED
jgi:hypothetical protein